MSPNQTHTAEYWRRLAIKRKQIAQWESGKPITACDREDYGTLQRNLKRNLELADLHLRQGEAHLARYEVLCARERLAEFYMRGDQLALSLIAPQEFGS